MMSARTITSSHLAIQATVLTVVISIICVGHCTAQENCTNKYDCNQNLCRASSIVACRNNKCECWTPTRYEKENNVEYIFPEGKCETVQDCNEWRIGGQIACINGYCACTHNSTYVRNYVLHIEGCLKHAGINEVCKTDIDCQGIGTKCLKSNDTDVEMTCKCGSEEEYNESTKRCNNIKNFGSPCNNDIDCKQDDLYCNRKEYISFGRCLCKDDYVVIGQQCILYIDTGILCQKDSHCQPGYTCYGQKIKTGHIFNYCKVIPVRYGGNCSINEQCEPHYNHMICDEEEKCSCGLDTVWSGDYQNCLSSNTNLYNSFGQHGSMCHSSDDCKTKGSTCSDDQNSYRICQCPVNSVYNHTECISTEDKDTNLCQIDSHCKPGYACFSDETIFKKCKVKTVKYGGDCLINEQCETHYNHMICDDKKKCSCEEVMVWSEDYQKCLSSKVNPHNSFGQHGSMCHSSDDCKIKGSICSADQRSYPICQCPENSTIDVKSAECIDMYSVFNKLYIKQDPDTNLCTKDSPCRLGYTCDCGENKTNCKFGTCKVEQVKYGENCSVSEQCKTKKDDALICNEENKCSCDQGFEWCAAYEHCCEMEHSSQNLTDQQDGHHNSSDIHGLSRKKISACSNVECGSSETSAVDNVTTRVYTTDSVNNNKEVSTSIQTSILSCVIGALVGGILWLAVLLYRNKRSSKKQTEQRLPENVELMEVQPVTVSSH